jgi:hypothetical protein
MILAHLKGEEPDTSDYSQNQISQAENSFLSFLEWEKGKKIEPEILETPIVDEEFEFGGTPDFIGVVDGIRTIMDFKTGSGIYEEMYYQLCAYEIAHLGINPDTASQQGIILNIPRSEDESFQVKIFHDFVPGWDVFEACLNIYNLRKEIKI